MKKKLLVLELSVAGVLMLSNTAFAGEWKRNNVGWWYQESTGAYPTSRWSNIGEKWYYFDNVGYMVHDKWIGDYYLGSDGAMLTSTVTPDGYRVDASEKHHALVLTDVRPNSMMGDYAFVEINGSGMDVKFHLGWDATEGERYYKDKTKISEQEFSEYFKDLKELDYM
ncbi:MAG: hypothetical protein Q3Y15_06535 [Candidatus Copromonas sp.]|nr:hypothetical protein [Candidatus Copromonas sp.]